MRNDAWHYPVDARCRQVSAPHILPSASVRTLAHRPSRSHTGIVGVGLSPSVVPPRFPVRDRFRDPAPAPHLPTIETTLWISELSWLQPASQWSPWRLA